MVLTLVVERESEERMARARVVFSVIGGSLLGGVAGFWYMDKAVKKHKADLERAGLEYNAAQERAAREREQQQHNNNNQVQEE